MQYTMEWAPGHCTFYIDGVSIGTSVTDVSVIIIIVFLPLYSTVIILYTDIHINTVDSITLPQYSLTLN